MRSAVAVLATMLAVACSTSSSNTPGTTQPSGSGSQHGAPASITLHPSTDSITAGQTAQFIDTVRDANGNVLAGQTVVWGTTNSAVATVSLTGVATAMAVGRDTVQAVAGGAVGKALLVVGSGALTHITISPNPASVQNGQTLPLAATALDAHGDSLSGYAFIWTTTNPAVTTVSQSGLLSAASPGTDTVHASSGGVTGSVVVTVQQTAPASIVVDPALDTVQVGSTIQMVDTVKDQFGHALNGQAVTWTTSNHAVASVSSTGRVTTVAAGAAVIAATSGKVSGNATIIVSPNNAPTTETFVFDKDTLVPFGQPFNVSQHVRWALKNSSGDSVGATTLASVSAVTYYPVLGSGNPGPCTLAPGTVATYYCPDGGWPNAMGQVVPYQYNGYWSVTVHAKPVSGVPDQHNTIWWYVHNYLPGSQPLTFSATTPTTHTINANTSANLALADTVYVETPNSAIAAASPLVGIDAASPACAITANQPVIHCPDAGVDYQDSVIATQYGFDGVSNPTFRVTILLTVRTQNPSPGNANISLAGTWLSNGNTNELANPWVCGPGGTPANPPPDTGIFAEPPAVALQITQSGPAQGQDSLSGSESGPYFCNQYLTPVFLTFPATGVVYDPCTTTNTCQVEIAGGYLFEGQGGCDTPNGVDCGYGPSWTLLAASADSLLVLNGPAGGYTYFVRTSSSGGARLRSPTMALRRVTPHAR